MQNDEQAQGTSRGRQGNDTNPPSGTRNMVSGNMNGSNKRKRNGESETFLEKCFKKKGKLESHSFLKSIDLVLERFGDNSTFKPITEVQLKKLCFGAQEFKNLKAMKAVPLQRLIRLIVLLGKNIQDHTVPVIWHQEANKNKKYLKLFRDSQSRSFLSSLTVLYILTSENMPKDVYLLEVIDRILIFAQYQLQYNILPIFDPDNMYHPWGKDEKSFKKTRRSHAGELNPKIIAFRNGMYEIVGVLIELLNTQVFPDTTLVHLSVLSVLPLFVANVPQLLQNAALKLATMIFIRFEDKRPLLLKEILTQSVGSSSDKLNLAQMAVHFIHCATSLNDKIRPTSQVKIPIDDDISIVEMTQSNMARYFLIAWNYDAAMTSAHNFVNAFLGKYLMRDSVDRFNSNAYRKSFEKFLNDLSFLSALPFCPAAELLLTVTANLIPESLKNTNIEIFLRKQLLEDFLIITARCHGRQVSNDFQIHTADKIISDIKAEHQHIDSVDTSLDMLDENEGEREVLDSEEDKTEYLLSLLLDYLTVNIQSNVAFQYTRDFFISAWWKVVQVAEGRDHEGRISASEPNTAASSQVREANVEKMNNLFTNIYPFPDSSTSRMTTIVSFANAQAISRYLMSKYIMVASRDSFLSRIIAVIKDEPLLKSAAFNILNGRLQAGDPNVQQNHDILLAGEPSIHHDDFIWMTYKALIDHKILPYSEVIDTCCAILSLNPLNRCKCIEKKTIHLLGFIHFTCVHSPKSENISRIYTKLMRKINENKDVKTLMETHFTYGRTDQNESDGDFEALLLNVSNAAQTTVASFNGTLHLDFFRNVLQNLFQTNYDAEDRENDIHVEQTEEVVAASVQMIKSLIEHGRKLIETNEENNPVKFEITMPLLLRVAKGRPQYFVSEAASLHGLIRTPRQDQGDNETNAFIFAILELVIPLLANPSQYFLQLLEKDMVGVCFTSEYNERLVGCKIRWLGYLVNKKTHNYELVRDLCNNYKNIIMESTKKMEENATALLPSELIPLQHAVHVIGLLLRYFDAEQDGIFGDNGKDIVDRMKCKLVYLLKDTWNKSLRSCSCMAIGNLCIRYPHLILDTTIKRSYQQLLNSSENDMKIKVLDYMKTCFSFKRIQVIQEDQDVTTYPVFQGIEETLNRRYRLDNKIVESYLKTLFEVFVSSSRRVRWTVLVLLRSVYHRELITTHQVSSNCSYLICMSTHPRTYVSSMANELLLAIQDKNYTFLLNQAIMGVTMSVKFRRMYNGYREPITPGNNLNAAQHFAVNVGEIPTVRGYRQWPREPPYALHAFLYNLLRVTQHQRRFFVLSLLNKFENQNRILEDLPYYADNLAYLPYRIIDEPMFILYNIDIMTTVTASNLLQVFEEIFIPPYDPADVIGNPYLEHFLENLRRTHELANKHLATRIGYEYEVDLLVHRVPADTTRLEQCIMSSLPCILLLELRNYLKFKYNILEEWITDYSPTYETDFFDMDVNPRDMPVFEPKFTFKYLKSPPSGYTLDGRRALIELYLQLKNYKHSDVRNFEVCSEAQMQQP